jgi:hypothetical protein
MNGMNTLDEIRAVSIASTEDTLIVDFDDGRTVQLPLIWYPRLYRATQAQRNNYQLTGRGYGVHWPDVDEDLSAKSLALGRPSIEFLRRQPDGLGEFGVKFHLTHQQRRQIQRAASKKLAQVRRRKKRVTHSAKHGLPA